MPPRQRVDATAPPPAPPPAPAYRPAAPAPAPFAADDAPPARDQVWDLVLRAVAARASLSWVRSLALGQFDGRTAVLSLLPGQREMRNFVTGERQRTLLADLFRQVVGRPVRVEIDAGAAPNAPASDAGAATPQRNERDEAMMLPLVRQVLQVFEATLVDTRAEQSGEAPAPSAAADEADVETA